MKLAIIKKWNISLGFCDNLDINKYKEYLQKKNFVIYTFNNGYVWEDFLDFLEIYKYLNNNLPVQRNLILDRYDFKVVKEYTFIERSFCNINYKFETFIAKCKKYYSQKINFYKKMKSPKLIMNRQIYGKKIKFKFKNV
jgi:hypothetical protein